MHGCIAHDTAKAATTTAEAAARRLATVERHLRSVFHAAVAEARDLVSEADLERLIIEATAGGFFKADDLAPIAWNETAQQGLALLGQAYEIVWVDVKELDGLWRSDGRHYLASVKPGVLQAIGERVRRGVMLPPPVFASLGDEWAFLEGRNRFLYARASGVQSVPVAVPADDADELFALAGQSPLPANEGERASPQGALARPYGDLNDAIEAIGMFIGNRFFSAVMAAATVMGENEANRLAAMIDARRTRKAGAVVDFETPNYTAIHELRLAAMNLIREFSEDQRAAVLAALRDGVERGINPREMARSFRSVVGLTAAQERYVQNYRRALERVHVDVAARANALERALHDNRFNPALARAARSGVPLTPAQIDKMTARYRERFVAHRAETIARTQALRAVHMGEAAVWQNAIESGDIVAAEVIQTWVTGRDERVRYTHFVMDDQRRPWGQPFESPSGAMLRFPGDPTAPAREVINCRCVLTRELTDEPVEVLPDDEPPADDDVTNMRIAGNFRNVAGQSGQGGSPYLQNGLPKNYGQSANLDRLSLREMRELLGGYQKQLQTETSRKITTYIDVLRTDIPRGSNLVGREFDLPLSATKSYVNPAIAAGPGRLGTILKLNIPQGSNALFGSASLGEIGLAPGARLIIRGSRYVSRAEYMEATGLPASAARLLADPGRRGFLLVDVDVISSQGTLRNLTLALESAIAERAPLVARLEGEIRDLNRARGPIEPESAPSVALNPKKGTATLNRYNAEAWDGANDIARNVVNDVPPIRVELQASPAYQAKVGSHRAPRLYVETEYPKPGSAAFGSFRHEFGHFVDDFYSGRDIGFKTVDFANDVYVTHRKWRDIVAAGESVAFHSADDVAAFLSQRTGVQLADLMDDGAALVRSFMEASVKRFVDQSQFGEIVEMFGDDLVGAFNFSRAVNAGDGAGVARAITSRHLSVHVSRWTVREDLRHAYHDLIGSMSRLEYGGGHAAEYYTTIRPLLNPVVLQSLDGGKFSFMTQANTIEVFANWFNLYTRSPGSRYTLRKLMPELHIKFEDFLKTIGDNRSLLDRIFGR